jgi:hypothetical protein
VLLAAAAAVGVIAVVGAVQLAGPGSSSSSDAAMSAGSGTGPATAEGGGTPQDAAILRSGRAYRKSTLAEQAQGLLSVSAVRAKGAPQGADRSSTPRATPAAEGLATVAPDADADDVTNPSRLAACLKQLGVGADRVVAVDLATFDGREAAILLLLSPEGGGHEVWAVERTCGEGSEGALYYTRVRD